MIKHVFWLPLTLVKLYNALLAPKWLFRRTYTPATESERMRSQEVRNAVRLAEYRAKRFLNKC